MKDYLKHVLLCLVLFSAFPALAQDSEAGQDSEPEQTRVKESTKKVKKQKARGHKLKFRNLDTNDDREISLKEFIEFKKHSLEKAFDRIDRDQDGVINRKEFMRLQKETRINKKRKKRN